MLKSIRLFCFVVIALPFLAIAQQDASSYKKLGKLRTKTTEEISSSNFTIGCEVLDRGYADYDQYKNYLKPLGAKTARIQAGWARTENVKGQYDWKWLDYIINDLSSKKIKPWVQFSYGNLLYEGGGGKTLAGGFPTSTEALKAWDAWVKAMVIRYGKKVSYWEVWNEPDLSGKNPASDYAKLFLRTSNIVLAQQPKARISGPALSEITHRDYLRTFLETMKKENKLSNLYEVSYHPYIIAPDYSYKHIDTLKAIIKEYSSTIKIKQGENGSPSTLGSKGSFTNHQWTENSQSKYLLRAMCGNFARSIPSSIFTIIDYYYPNEYFGSGLNTQGLISAPDRKFHHLKQAYFAAQNAITLLSDDLEKIDLKYKLDLKSIDTGRVWLFNEKFNFSLFGFKDKKSKKEMVAIWQGGNIPDSIDVKSYPNLSLENFNVKDPVYIDLKSGEVYAIPQSTCRKNGNNTLFDSVPIYDSPIIITDKSLVVLN